jgi:hypothetical protein
MAINEREGLNYFLEWAGGDIVEYILTLCLTGARYNDFLDWITYCGLLY